MNRSAKSASTWAKPVCTAAIQESRMAKWASTWDCLANKPGFAVSTAASSVSTAASSASSSGS